jgi:hypothetical protein
MRTIWRTARFRGIGWLLAVLCAGLFCLGTAAPALAQDPALRPGRLPAAPGTGAAPAPATEYRPERVRDLLLAIHGFSREALLAASTDVPAILQGFVAEPSETMLVRRQAIKALALFPTSAGLAFIEQHVPAASPGFKSLYLSSLKAFAAAYPQRVEAIVTPLLADGDGTVRVAAVKLAGHLRGSLALEAALRERLVSEPSEAVRQAIQRVLQPQ